jgi:hypothetical protein
MTTAFPATPDFSGHNAPSRIECDIFDLVVEGTLPADKNGELSAGRSTWASRVMASRARC